MHKKSNRFSLYRSGR